MMLHGHVSLIVATANLAFCQKLCSGYTASNVQQTSSGLTADLTLAGPPCDIYGTDLPNLTLTVEYQTTARLHVLIEDQNQTVYQVPQSVFQRPNASNLVSAADSQLSFTYTANPFSFAVSRSNGEVLFNTSGSPLVFESQYLNLRTSLPQNPNLYGLGEHSDPFRLNTTNYTRTIWNRDAYSIPPGTNLYGSQPIYVDHRGANGTHAVILVNSNGLEIKINDTAGQYLEYNSLGGVFDFYFVAGPSPPEVSQQIAEVVGLPAMVSYGSFGFHQCRYGYRDVYEVAGVVYNYSQANIPLETMWTDIDYMHNRWIFNLDPDRFPLDKMRQLIDYLHAHQQKYTVMVDPAVAYQDYSGFNDGRDADIFLKEANGSIYKGVVWPGVTAFPDWFHPDTQAYWSNQFNSFFNADSGVDIDYLWIDMNEASNFCDYPCSDPESFAAANDFPPAPPPVRNSSPIALPGFPPDFQAPSVAKVVRRQGDGGSMIGLSGRELINPPYKINNAAGSLSNHTLNTNLVHYNGLVEFDTHNIYGAMMSRASHLAMLSRRPTERTLVITRSTFLGAGTYTGHWLGDNLSDWPHYRISIAQMLAFSSMFQLPMVGSDVCGFGSNTTSTLCSRWMMLGAFYPFYRNHNELGSISQEAYRWDSVAAAARRAISIRYQMMDYFYTCFYLQTQNGTPSLNPMFYIYPDDSNTFGVDLQFFYGNALLVSPVTEENATSVDIYLPNDVFYDWNNGLAPVRGSGSSVTLDNVDFQTIPLHIRGGTIIPLRSQSANTTTELRKQPFHIVIALGVDGSASGSLYLDEGLLIEQPNTSLINFTFSNGTFCMTGQYGYNAGVNIETVSVLGLQQRPSGASIGGLSAQYTYNATSHVAAINCSIPLTGDANMTLTNLASYPGSGSTIQISTKALAASILVGLLMVAYLI